MEVETVESEDNMRQVDERFPLFPSFVKNLPRHFSQLSSGPRSVVSTFSLSCSPLEDRNVFESDFQALKMQRVKFCGPENPDF